MVILCDFNCKYPLDSKHSLWWPGPKLRIQSKFKTKSLHMHTTTPNTLHWLTSLIKYLKADGAREFSHLNPIGRDRNFYLEYLWKIYLIFVLNIYLENLNNKFVLTKRNKAEKYKVKLREVRRVCLRFKPETSRLFNK